MVQEAEIDEVERIMLGFIEPGYPRLGIRHGLDAEIADTRAMNEGQRWETTDPLGIGGLLFVACRVVQLTAICRPREKRVGRSAALYRTW